MRAIIIQIVIVSPNPDTIVFAGKDPPGNWRSRGRMIFTKMQLQCLQDLMRLSPERRDAALRTAMQSQSKPPKKKKEEAPADFFRRWRGRDEDSSSHFTEESDMNSSVAESAGSIASSSKGGKKKRKRRKKTLIINVAKKVCQKYLNASKIWKHLYGKNGRVLDHKLEPVLDQVGKDPRLTAREKGCIISNRDLLMKEIKKTLANNRRYRIKKKEIGKPMQEACRSNFIDLTVDNDSDNDSQTCTIPPSPPSKRVKEEPAQDQPDPASKHTPNGKSPRHDSKRTPPTRKSPRRVVQEQQDQPDNEASSKEEPAQDQPVPASKRTPTRRNPRRASKHTPNGKSPRRAPKDVSRKRNREVEDSSTRTVPRRKSSRRSRNEDTRTDTTEKPHLSKELKTYIQGCGKQAVIDSKNKNKVSTTSTVTPRIKSKQEKAKRFKEKIKSLKNKKTSSRGKKPTGKWKVGTKMARFFGEGKKKKLFIGQVTKVVGKNYHVLYEDGDEEDLDKDELQYAVELYEHEQENE